MKASSLHGSKAITHIVIYVTIHWNGPGLVHHAKKILAFIQYANNLPWQTFSGRQRSSQDTQWVKWNHELGHDRASWPSGQECSVQINSIDLDLQKSTCLKTLFQYFHSSVTSDQNQTTPSWTAFTHRNYWKTKKKYSYLTHWKYTPHTLRSNQFINHFQKSFSFPRS